MEQINFNSLGRFLLPLMVEVRSATFASRLRDQPLMASLFLILLYHQTSATGAMIRDNIFT